MGASRPWIVLFWPLVSAALFPIVIVDPAEVSAASGRGSSWNWPDALGSAAGKPGVRGATRGWLNSVVVVGSTVFSSEVCNSSNWHGTLPLYLARVLHKENATLLAWDGVASMQGEKDCWVCDPGGTGLSPGSRSDRFRCKDWFGSQGRPRTAKMAVAMACSDREVRWCRGISRHGYLNCTEANLPRTGDYKGLRWCTEQPWIERGATRLVHLPVARHDDDRTAALGFDSVVDDHQYLKPVRLPEAIRPWDPEAGPMVCEPGAAREQVLLYVGRLRCGTKGQQAFVESVDPGLLAGLAIEFFFSENGESEEFQLALKRLLKTGMERGIKMRIHVDSVPAEELFMRACQARGLIHFAEKDNNPRVPYEMLYAGLPVFITRQSDTPELLNHQPFVVLTDYAARGAPTSSLDVDFKRFLNLTRHLATVEMDIRRFLTSELLEEKVYGRVCEQMGLCKPSILVHIGIRGNHR